MQYTPTSPFRPAPRRARRHPSPHGQTLSRPKSTARRVRRLKPTFDRRSARSGSSRTPRSAGGGRRRDPPGRRCRGHSRRARAPLLTRHIDTVRSGVRVEERRKAWPFRIRRRQAGTPTPRPDVPDMPPCACGRTAARTSRPPETGSPSHSPRPTACSVDTFRVAAESRFEVARPQTEESDGRSFDGRLAAWPSSALLTWQTESTSEVEGQWVRRHSAKKLRRRFG